MDTADDKQRGDYRVTQVVLGAAIGAALGGPAGVVGGAALGALGEVCAQRLLLHPTSPWKWLEAFGFASGGAGSVTGAVQGGVEGASVGAFVGGVIGCFVGVSFGVMVWAISRAGRFFTEQSAAADRSRDQP